MISSNVVHFKLTQCPRINKWTLQLLAALKLVHFLVRKRLGNFCCCCFGCGFESGSMPSNNICLTQQQFYWSWHGKFVEIKMHLYSTTSICQTANNKRWWLRQFEIEQKTHKTNHAHVQRTYIQFTHLKTHSRIKYKGNNTWNSRKKGIVKTKGRWKIQSIVI